MQISYLPQSEWGPKEINCISLSDVFEVFPSLVESRVKTGNPFSNFALEGVITKEILKGFIKLLISKQTSQFPKCKFFVFWTYFPGAPIPVKRYEIYSEYSPHLVTNCIRFAKKKKEDSHGYSRNPCTKNLFYLINQVLTKQEKTTGFKSLRVNW